MDTHVIKAIYYGHYSIEWQVKWMMIEGSNGDLRFIAQLGLSDPKW